MFEQKIIDVLRQNNELNILEIASALNMDRHTVAKYLEVLRSRGLIVYETKGKSKIWKLIENPFSDLLGVNDFISSQVLTILTNLDYDVSIQSKNYDIIWHSSKKHQGKCYEVLKGKRVPCRNCPSSKVFESGLPQKTLVNHGNEKKMMISEPIKNERGEVVAVIELTKGTKDKGAL